RRPGGWARDPERAARLRARTPYSRRPRACPRPAFFDLVDGDALALERLGVERRIGGGRLAQRRRGFDDLVKLRLSHSATPRARRARARPGTRRPRAVRACCSGSRRRCRNATTPWPPRQTGARTTRQ